MSAEKPIIRIAVPGDTAEEFMQAAAKQFRGDFFVAIDQPVGKFVRIEAPFLAGGVAVRGDAIAMPAVRNGRKGLVIRLVKLDSDSLGIPIPEASKQLTLTEESEESAIDEFEPQPTMASNVSAAVAQSIRASGNAAPVAVRQPIPTPGKAMPKLAGPPPKKLEELDDETREAVAEFGGQATRASEISADLAKQLAEARAEKPVATAHAVRRASKGASTPASGVPKEAPATPARPKSTAAEDDAAFDDAFADLDAKEPPKAESPKAEPPKAAPESPKPNLSSVHDKATVEMVPELKPSESKDEELAWPAAAEAADDDAPTETERAASEDEPVEAAERAPSEAAAVAKTPDKGAVNAPAKRPLVLLLALLLAAVAAAAIYFLK